MYTADEDSNVINFESNYNMTYVHLSIDLEIIEYNSESRRKWLSLNSLTK